MSALKVCLVAVATGLLAGCNSGTTDPSDGGEVEAYETSGPAPAPPPPSPPSPPDPNGWFVGLAGDGECVRLTDLGSASTPVEFADNLRGAGVEVGLNETDDPNIVSLRTYSPRTASYVLARPKGTCDSALIFMSLATQ